MHATSAVSQRQKYLTACNACYRSKLRCDGGLPCQRCTSTKRVCNFSRESRRHDMGVSASGLSSMTSEQQMSIEGATQSYSTATGTTSNEESSSTQATSLQVNTTVKNLIPDTPRDDCEDQAPSVPTDPQQSQWIQVLSTMPGSMPHSTDTDCNHGEQLPWAKLVQLSRLLKSDFDAHSDRWFQAFCLAKRKQHLQITDQHTADSITEL